MVCSSSLIPYPTTNLSTFVIARHVFGSVIGLHQAYIRLPQDKRTSLKAHFTLLDIKSTALARDLCILILLNDLISDGREAQERSEIKATIFYIYTGVIVPQYCYARCVRLPVIFLLHRD